MDVAQALAAAAAAWPDLPPPDESFAAELARRRDDSKPDLHVGDLFLAYHASRGTPAAVGELTALLETLRGSLRRTGAPEQMIGELLADLPGDLVTSRDAAPARILGYTGRGPLAAWLRVVAVRAIVERRRRVASATDDEPVGALAAAADDPELALLRQVYRGELEAAFAEAFRELSPADRLLLRQSHVDGLTIDRLAMIHGIHRATAARRVAAARAGLFERIRGILLARLKIGDDTFASIVRLVRSELAISLDRYL